LVFGTIRAHRQATAPSPAATTKARPYPPVRAAAVLWWLESRLWVRSIATVARAARPTDPPTWRDVLRTPEAKPASV